MTAESAVVLAMRQLVAEAALFRRGAARSGDRLATLQERRRLLRPAPDEATPEVR